MRSFLCDYLFKVVLISFVLTFNVCQKNQDMSHFRFSNGVSPVLYDVGKDSITNPDNEHQLLTDSKSCASCHERVYQNWLSSRHRVSYTNEIYQQSHKQEPMSWCLNCHAPFVTLNSDHDNPLDRFQKEDGISCITCHVRNGKILTSKVPKKELLSHRYQEIPQMETSEFCANCHQFSFPTVKSMVKGNAEFHYSKLPMQDTYEEWKRSPYYNKKQCQSCHLFPRSKFTHSFPGGHSLDDLSSAFVISIEKKSENAYLVEIETKNIGHSFPTGDLFRTVRLRVYSPEKKFQKEWVFRKAFSVRQNPKSDEASKVLSEDTVIESNSLNGNKKSLIWMSDKRIESIYYELFIEYQNGINQLVSKIASEDTIKKFQSGTIKVSK